MVQTSPGTSIGSGREDAPSSTPTLDAARAFVLSALSHFGDTPSPDVIEAAAVKIAGYVLKCRAGAIALELSQLRGNAAARGAAGGRARAASMTPAQRASQARKAASARWGQATSKPAAQTEGDSSRADLPSTDQTP